MSSNFLSEFSLGKYRVVDLLGKGGFGTVYRAIDTTLDREVALKILHPQLTNDRSFVDRFQNEAKAVASLDHANVVGIYEIGEYDGRVFIAMEYMPRGTLEDRIARGRLPFTDSLTIMQQVCGGLGSAHARGLVHRDIKPANILFAADGRAVVGDFGLVRAVQQTTQGTSSSWAEAGTPHYKAPELWDGQPPASPATDVYALGCVLYEMLTRKVLFSGDTPEQVIAKHLIYGPQFGGRWLPVDALPTLEEVVKRALLRDPAQRYATAGAFADALSNVRPGAAQPIARTEKFDRERKPAAEPKRHFIPPTTQQQKRPSFAWLATVGGVAVLVACLLSAVGGLYYLFPKSLPTVSTSTPASPGSPTQHQISAQASALPPSEIPALASDLPVIEPANVSQLAVLARFGRGRLEHIAWSPDGSTLAIATSTGVYLHDANSLDELSFLQLGADSANQVAWSSDSVLLAIASSSGIYICDAKSLAQLRFINTTTSTNSVAFSPGNYTLASGGADKTVRLWDANSGQPIRALAGQTKEVNAVAFSPDGSLLASGGDDTNVYLWKVSDGQLLYALEAHPPSAVLGLAFSPSGATLASGSKGAGLSLWNVASGELIRTAVGDYHGGASDIYFSADNRVLFWANLYGVAQRDWDMLEDTILPTFPAGGVTSIALSPDGRRLVSGTGYGTVQLWDVTSTQELEAIGKSSVLGLAFSPNAKTLASAGSDALVRLWNLTGSGSTQPPRVLEGHTGQIFDIAYSPDGKVLATVSEDGTVRLWDTGTDQVMRTLEANAGKVFSVAFSPNGQTLALGSETNTIQLWDLGTGELVRTFIGYGGEILSVAFSPDGRTLASGDTHNYALIWDVNSGHLASTLDCGGPVRGVAFSPDGDMLATVGGIPCGGKLWDVESNAVIRTLSRDAYGAVAFSPDGQVLASSRSQANIGLWSVARQNLDSLDKVDTLRDLKGHTDAVLTVAFSPDGRFIASASEDGVILVWGVNP